MDRRAAAFGKIMRRLQIAVAVLVTAIVVLIAVEVNSLW